MLESPHMAKIGRLRPGNGRSISRAAGAILIFSLGIGAAPAARTIEVPRDFATIKAAVAAARDGDTVLVSEGTYVEDNIVVDKRIRLLSGKPYGAAVYGSVTRQAAIFIVRAEAEIAGFVLKNSDSGILQRDSPDVEWTARDLLIMNMEGTGISVNDIERNVGFARLSNIVVANCQHGIGTNDARGIDLQGALLVRCKTALPNSNQLAFTANGLAFWDCAVSIAEDGEPIPPATNRIRLGPRVSVIPDPRRRPGRAAVPALLPDLPFADRTEPDSALGEAALHRRAIAANLYGALLLDSGQAAAALELFGTAAGLALRLGAEEILWEAEFGRGRALERLGRLEEAALSYRAAAASVDRIARALSLHLVSGGFFLDKLALYRAGLDLAVRLNGADASKGYDREALEWAERTRAGTPLDRVETPPDSIDANRHPLATSRGAGIAAAVSRLQLRLQDDTLAADARRRTLEELAGLENEYRSLLMAARRADPGWARALPPRRAAFEEIRAALPDGAGLLEYVLGPERSLLLFLSREDYVIAPLPPAGEIETAVRAYLNFLTVPDERDFKGARGGRLLRNALIAPAGPALERVRRLIVVPDGCLHHLPFEALAARGDPVGAGKGAFLIGDFAFSYMPSAAAIVPPPERAGERRPAAGFLGIAADRGAASAYPGPNLGAPLKPLPNAAGEVRAAARFFSEEGTVLLLGRNAREDRLKGLDLGAYRVLHFACHGVLDQDHAWRSSLILRSGGGEDGCLQPMDILRFDLNAELVVLSACRTAAGGVESGGRIRALSQSFIAAGAAAVVSSLWRVDDVSTSLFMRFFYRRLSAGAAIAEALRLAKIDMLETRRSHPFHWAGFVLMGNGNDPVFGQPDVKAAGR